ncbi:MAG TPA: type VI secretion system baseplate subunit TssF [Amaricoccus sp.]|nr:type VI secretion system baseplate subunit TssF [Amaricoccus sp.]
MDRAFLEYYEDELAHVRALASEFAEMHPAVARNLSLDTAPCPDPYVERLLDGVAFLAARTRLKLDGEGARFARAVLDALYPDLISPTPAVGMAVLQPGQQVQTMLAGHVVPRGTRLVAGLRPGLSTRATYSTAQDVTLWPLEIRAVAYHQDRSALAAAGIGAIAGEAGQAALKLTLARSGPGALAELDLDRLDLHFAGRSKAAALFDSLFGAVTAVGARPAAGEALQPLRGPSMVGIDDSEALMPRTRAGFEGYRLLREYFIMPERFHYARLDGLRPVVARSGDTIEVVFLLGRQVPELADVHPGDFRLFATPVINLFERDCNVVEIDPRRPRQVLHADRTRPRDFEIYRLTVLEDADRDGPEARILPLFGFGQDQRRPVWWAERRPRRPGEDERRQGRLRTSYAGDDVFVMLSVPPGTALPDELRRLDARALCTNRDLPLLDDQPALTLESGDPVQAVTLLGALRPPRPAMPAVPAGRLGESRADELAWRLVAQLSLNYLGLAVEGGALEPLAATLALYADRGDPALARHARSLTGVDARPVVERLPIPGPLCFGRGTEVTLDVDEAVLAGHSVLMLSALLSRLFARYAAVNGFVQTRTRLLHGHEEVQWPIALGNRSLV